ncbi:MAG: hypothetical protein QNJ54_38005 [Prochloraceae cyanobacterium]|nr:hypothetical protein [Prochloraceae cyanobacterium]
MNRELERLEIRISFIRERMEKIRSSGKVAPAKTWIQKYYVKKPSGKKYYYYRLLEATNRKSSTGKIQGKVRQYLGNKHSSKYHTYKAAIQRRNELKFLLCRYEQLMAIYEKAISELVGKGYFEERERGEVSIETSSQTNFIPAAVEKLEASNEQLWYWLKVIAEKLGVKISEGLEVINSS